jgi:hypothetical protein
MNAKPEKKYGAVVILDKDGVPKQYPRDMPIFVLVGQDLAVPAAVDAYAAGLEVEAARCETETPKKARDLRKQAELVKAFAIRLRAWQIVNPEHVKWPD